MSRRTGPLAAPSLTVHGVGIDAVDIEHFARTVKAHPAFLKVVFTRREYRRYRFRMQSLAARFGVKEAFVKAVGLARSFPWRDIETLADSYGRPYVVLHGRASRWCRQWGIRQVLVSMSHSRTMAIAQVVLLRDQVCPACTAGLARIFHQLSAAGADTTTSPGRTPSGLLDIVFNYVCVALSAFELDLRASPRPRDENW